MQTDIIRGMDSATDASVNQKSGDTLNIEQSLEKPSEGTHRIVLYKG